MIGILSKYRFNYLFHFLFIILALNFTFFIIPDASAATQASFAWEPNSEPDLAGYRIFSREQNQSYDYANPSWEGTNTYSTIYNLDEGKSYCFVVRAFDTEGLESEDSNEDCLAGGSNVPPAVAITSPGDGSGFTEGDPVGFDGTAEDTEDGNLATLLTWTSNLDGPIGAGGSFATSSLSIGTHTITATVTDSGGLPGNDSIFITISESRSFDVLDFDQTSTVAYSNQDRDGTVTIEDGGATLHMQGNRWRRTEQVYEITPDTVLEFDFMSTIEGEIHGIGFEEDDNLTNDQRIFQLFGTQTWSTAYQWNPQYTASNVGSYVHFSIPVGQYYTGSNMYLAFVSDDDGAVIGNSWFKNIRVVDGRSNVPPEVVITSPGDGSGFTEGDPVGFDGTAEDTEDGNLATLLTWTSNLDGPIGAGGSFATSSLSIGTHTITATVTDSESLPGNDSIFITISESRPIDVLDFDQTSTVAYSNQDRDGTVTIEDGGATLHMQGNRWRRTEQVYEITPDTVLEFDFMSTIEGEIHGIGFEEDDNLTNDQRIFQLFGTQTWSTAYQWNPQYTASNVGSYVHFSIPVGQYYTGSNMYLAFVSDDDGAVIGNSWFKNIRVVDGRSNVPPEVVITSPGDGSGFTEGDPVGFDGTAEDTEDGNLTTSLTWTSNLDGSIGAGGYFVTNTLSIGTHTITATVTDSGGLSGNDSVSITITQGSNPNVPPAVAITSPGDGSGFTEGSPVGFDGTAEDTEDGNLATSLTWASNLDGPIGAGGSFVTSSLSIGTHTITATVTDSGGLPGNDSVSITISESRSFDVLDFDQTSTVAYSNQDRDGTVTIEDGGATLHMQGNRWRRTEQVYEITPDTVLEFDFMSTIEGEIHGIGFEEDDNLWNGRRIFQFFGTANLWGAYQWSPPYTANDMGSYVHFSIPVGQFYSGSNMHVVFVNDDDGAVIGNSWFKNIRIVDGSSNNGR